jgi:hypothetical protein
MNRQITNDELSQLADAALRTHSALNIYNSADRNARKAKQEYERLSAEQWRISERILKGQP